MNKTAKKTGKKMNNNLTCSSCWNYRSDGDCSNPFKDPCGLFEPLWLPARESKTENLILLAEQVSDGARCLSRKVGAVLQINNRRIYATNGPPAQMPACIYCLRKEKNITPGTRIEYCFAVHAEQRVLIKAAKAGLSPVGADLYIFMDKKESICQVCWKMLLVAEVKTIVLGWRDCGELKTFKIK